MEWSGAYYVSLRQTFFFLALGYDAQYTECHFKFDSAEAKD